MQQSEMRNSVAETAPVNEYALEARGISKSFGGFFAVKDVDLKIRRGSVHALIGPNGAGKTTCFNMLTKALQPTSGQILLEGRDISRLPTSEVAQLGLVRSFQISATFPHLTCLENVRVALQSKYGKSFHFWRSLRAVSELNERAMALLGEVGLGDSAGLPASDLSYGKKRALEIATTLALDPSVMLLDEPTAGMGHEDIEPITELIARVGKDRTIVIIEHNLSVVSTLSERITVLKQGEVLTEGTYAEVSSNPDVISAYMEASMSSETGKNPLLQVENLNAWYAESQALHGMSFVVPEGELVTLIGRNGAGKSTTLRSIMGIVRKRKGSIRFKGAELIGRQTYEIARQGIAYCPEERAIFASLSVRENLGLPPVLSAGGSTDEELLEQFPNLRARQNSTGTMLSGGEQQMLAIARILRTGSRFLLLDEPSEGLAPVVVKEIGQQILRLKERGYTILLVEQNLKFAQMVADRHVVVEHGRVVDVLAADQLQANMARVKTYLGV